MKTTLKKYSLKIYLLLTLISLFFTTTGVLATYFVLTSFKYTFEDSEKVQKVKNVKVVKGINSDIVNSSSHWRVYEDGKALFLKRENVESFLSIKNGGFSRYSPTTNLTKNIYQLNKKDNRYYPLEEKDKDFAIPLKMMKESRVFKEINDSIVKLKNSSINYGYFKLNKKNNMYYSLK